MKKALFIIVLVLIAAAYVGGYWPQRARVQQAEQASAQANQQVAAARELASMYRIQNDLLALTDQTQSLNYGQAQKLSGTFFDDVRQHVDKYPNAPYTATLQGIVGERDSVTSALTRADNSVLGTLRQNLSDIRQIGDKVLAQANLQ
jgi:predicted negative regulator of RcsB-dependent stress response